MSIDILLKTTFFRVYVEDKATRSHNSQFTPKTVNQIQSYNFMKVFLLPLHDAVPSQSLFLNWQS